MRKYVLLLLFLLMFSVTYPVYADPEISKGIERSIVTKIEWFDKDKVILIHSILVKKFKNQPLVVDRDFIITVRDESFKNRTLTNEEARNFVLQNAPLGVDHIFDRKVDVFKDISGQSEVSQNDIDRVIKELKEQVSNEWNNPKSHSNLSFGLTLWRWIKALKEVIFVVLGVSLFFLYFYIRAGKAK